MCVCVCVCVQGRGATETPMVTDSAAVKQEKMDPEYGDHSLESMSMLPCCVCVCVCACVRACVRV